MTIIPLNPFLGLLYPQQAILHTYVYVCYVYEREEEEEGRREVIA